MWTQSMASVSNSNSLDNKGRAFTTSISAPSGSSGAVSNQSGNIQGLHSIYGSFSAYTPRTFATRNSANIGGHPNGAQQAPGSVSHGRTATNNLTNALSQLSLGSSHGHGGATDTRAVVPNMGHSGRITNSIGGLVSGGNTTRGSGSAGVTNIPGLASRMNLAAPQMVSMPGNSNSGAGMSLSQNQFQDGNSYFSFVPFQNDSSAHDIDVIDFSQLSGRPPPSGGSHGQQGMMMQKHNYSFAQQNQDFSIQNEIFSSLPEYKDGFDIGDTSEYTVNVHQKEHLRDSMANLMQSQQFSMGRSPGFTFGGTYASHHPLRQDRASSVNSSGFSFLTSGSQNFHSQGFEPYQHFQQSPSRYNQFRDKEMRSAQGSQLVPDEYGILGLFNIMKRVNPAKASLALGIDLTNLGLDLNSPETLHQKFASPWSDESVREEPKYSIPECYYAAQPPSLKQSYFVKFKLETLFYIFYSMPKDEAQLFAANELHNRGWFYHREFRLWFTRMKNTVPLVKTNTYERGCYICFDPNTWQTIRKDNFLMQYGLIEKRPALPQ